MAAGDSFLAGLVLRIADGRDLQSAFCMGVAAGAPTAMTEATQLCHSADVERLEVELARAITETCPP